jgi:ABC-type sugar transport system ATPase subunit
MTDDQPLLTVTHLTKTFKDLAALDDVSLQVERGTIHAIVGETGAGKTTLMKILGGHVRAGEYGGEVRLAGQPLRLRTPADPLRLGIACVPRKVAILENCSVADNITLASWQLRKRFWISRGAELTECEALLHEWSIDIALDAPVRTLTPVQKRLLMIARGLAVNPQLVVLDEPLAEIAGFHARAQLLRFVHRLAEHGLACLYLTQRADEAITVASVITVLRDGVIAGTWQSSEFDAAAIAAVLPGTRAGLPTADDDFGQSGGMFGSLNEYFGRMLRPPE